MQWMKYLTPYIHTYTHTHTHTHTNTHTHTHTRTHTFTPITWPGDQAFKNVLEHIAHTCPVGTRTAVPRIHPIPLQRKYRMQHNASTSSICDGSPVMCVCVCVCVCVRVCESAHTNVMCIYLCKRVCMYSVAVLLARVCARALSHTHTGMHTCVYICHVSFHTLEQGAHGGNLHGIDLRTAPSSRATYHHH